MDPLSALNIDSLRATQAEREAADDQVGQSNFLEMLVAQLENQDPLNPQDSAEFAAQLAQFSTVEQLIAVRSGVDELVSLSRTGEGADQNGTANIDPTNLVGRDVVVFGSQIEVDASGTPVVMDFRTIDAAFDGNVRLIDANGKPVTNIPLLATDPNTGQKLPLRAGDHTFTIDPAQLNLPVGKYAIEFTAQNASGEAVTVLPMVTGTVTGAILTGEPSVRMGSQIFRVADILEVKLAAVAP